MGAYLSTPITHKDEFEGMADNIAFGGSAMQGWRRTMEDSHLARCLDDGGPGGQPLSLFGVFDGHGGAEVAKFCERYMAEEFTRLREQGGRDADVGATLVKAFHRMDDMLRDPKYQEELEQLKTKSSSEESKSDEDGVSGTMDALDLLKRVFQLKRFMGGDTSGNGGNNNGNGEGAGGSNNQAQSPAIKVDEVAPDADDNMVQAGCTAVVAIKCGNTLYVANAGDSRGVLCRNGSAIALSEDHKPASERERARIIAAGGFLSEIGGVCRVNGNLNLSRAIGDLKYKSGNELEPKDQIITAEPDICQIGLTPEDRFFVLACDGIWDVMSNQDVVDFVSAKLDSGMTPSQTASALLDACLANDPKEARGVGCDNMTAVVIELRKGEVGQQSRSHSASQQHSQRPSVDQGQQQQQPQHSQQQEQQQQQQPAGSNKKESS